MKTRKVKFNKFGPSENLIGLQVCLPFKGREILGDVISATYNHTLGVIQIGVRHFNGEMWPIVPTAMAVNVIG